MTVLVALLAFAAGLALGLWKRKRFIFVPLNFGSPIPKGDPSMDAPNINLGDAMKQPFAVGSGIDAAGNPAPLEDLVVSSSDESIVTITDLGGGSYEAVAVGPLGTFQVNAAADAQIGDGIEPISGTLFTGTVVAGKAVGFAVTLGEQVAK